MRRLKAFLMEFRSTFLETLRPDESGETPALLETGTVLEKQLPLVSFWFVCTSTKLAMPRSLAALGGGTPMKSAEAAIARASPPSSRSCRLVSAPCRGV